jgi:signal transduction histidine kinase
MEPKSLFWDYLRRHIKIMFMIAAFVGIFALVFSLYDLPVEAVGYAALLCFLLGVLLFVIGYLRHLRRHRELSALLHSITLSIDALPEPRGALERDYQALIRALYEDKTALAFRSDSERSDMVEYYTMWAHQIKTPIAAMRLLLQSEQNPLNSQLSSELFKIEQYVEMVLQYLRLSSDSSDLVLRQYALDDIVRGALRKYAKMFILSRLALDFRETNLQVLTDEKWLSFVLEQLLSNALKYTSKGTISIYSQDKTLIIEDTGIGIRAEDLPRVCDRGYTGYNGRADKKSTGIGLYLCKTVCTKLGHSIRIDSAPGAGTRVFLELDTVELKPE